MPNTHLRNATPDDAPAIQKLIQSEGMPLFDFTDYLNSFWVLEAENEIVGCVGLEMYGSSTLLRSIVVSPTLRGNGDGFRLTKHIIDESRARGATAVYLFTMDKAPFFSRYGFQPIGMSDFDPDVQQSTQYRAVTAAPPEVAKILTKMRLRLVE